MQKKQFALVIVAIATVIACTCDAQQVNPDALKEHFSAMNRPGEPGCAIAAQAPGIGNWSYACGEADLEHAVAITPETVFEAGSVSKQFTAAAVLLLAERHQVDLDKSITSYFPELPGSDRGITVRMLFNHTSGLRDWGEIEGIAGWPRTTREYTEIDILKILSRQSELNFAPGMHWSYSNSGYNLLAMLVERITHTSFEDFTQRAFFVPLGMHSTRWRTDFRDIVQRRAVAYTRRGKDWRQDMPFEDTFGHGGLLTTVGDLLLWNRAILGGTFHSAVFRQMEQHSKLTDGQTVNYGLGFFLSTYNGMREVRHDGATAGYRAWLAFYPEKNLSVAVLCNATAASPSEDGHQLVGLLLGQTSAPAFPKAPSNAVPGLYVDPLDQEILHIDVHDGLLLVNGAPSRLPSRFENGRMFLDNPTSGEERYERVEPWTPKSLRAFEGTFVSRDADVTFVVSAQDGKLRVQRGLAPDLVLEAAYKDTFSTEDFSMQYLRDAHGSIDGLRVSNSRVWNLKFTRQRK